MTDGIYPPGAFGWPALRAYPDPRHDRIDLRPPSVAIRNPDDDRLATLVTAAVNLLWLEASAAEVLEHLARRAYALGRSAGAAERLKG